MAEQEQLAGDALRLLAIGEVMAEIRTEGNEGFALGFAGDSYNTAVYAARNPGVWRGCLSHPCRQ